MTVESACRNLITELQSRPTVRAGSLITTVFGDAISPRGGTVWLGSLIGAMEGFGIGERLVRTSVFRLAQDGWLQSVQVGRRSYYCLTEDGSARFAQATHRIYGEPSTAWDGQWCLLLLSGLDGESKEQVRKEFGWLGFGALSTNVLAHPAPDYADIDISINRLGLDEKVIVMTGQTIRSESAMRSLARASWNLDEIDARYADFVRRFRPLIAALGKNPVVKRKTAFLIRTLLVHEYRTVLLRDPQLPGELLPPGWHGTAAYQLCRNLYKAVYEQADDYMSATLETAEGPLPPPASTFVERFGGLQ